MLPDEVGTPFGDELCDLVPDMPTVREDEVLHLRPAGVRRLDDAKDACSVTAARGEERIEGVTPEIRVHGHRVGEWRLAVRRLQVRRCVGARRRADVAALRVGDHLQSGGARVRTDVFEGAHAIGAERLEERDLRLDGDDVRRHRVDQATTEALAGSRRLLPAEMGLALQLDGQKIWPRIEPDDELGALPLDRLGQAVGEVRRRDSGHTRESTSRQRRQGAARRRRPRGGAGLACPSV